MQRFRAIFIKFPLNPFTSFCSRTKILCSTFSSYTKTNRLDHTRCISVIIPSPEAHLYTKKINWYAKNNRLKDALQLFDEMPERDTVAWNSMIKGCLECKYLTMARKLFDEMPEKNVVSWTTMVNGYMKFGRVEMAKGLFEKMPFKDVAAWNAVIHGYFANGRVDEAIRVFNEMPSRNIISWTSMISGLDQNGRSVEALRLFREMVSNRVELTERMSSCLITACVNVMAVELGTQIHGRIVKLGYLWDDFVTSSLITLYANCKRLEDCRRVFSEKEHDNVAVWTSLLTGYSLNDMHDDALFVFYEMTKVGVLPNESSFTSALNSCCALVSLDSGRLIQASSIKLGFEASTFVGSSLVTLYSKCGNIQEAVKAFEGMTLKNLVSWNSIIVGCAQHGHAILALICFARMMRLRVEPDEITLTGLLQCASHSGMFLKGRRFFMYFSKYTAVKLNLLHYSCMVVIICRSGNLDEAEEFIKNMPIKPNSLVLLELLSACREHSNFEIAERVSKQILVLDPQCGAVYTLMSNLYASASRWDDVSRIRSEMKSRNVTKQGGHSWVNQSEEKLACSP